MYFTLQPGFCSLRRLQRGVVWWRWPAIGEADSAAVGPVGDDLQVSVGKEAGGAVPVSYTHFRAHETGRNTVSRLQLEHKNNKYRSQQDNNKQHKNHHH